MSALAVFAFGEQIVRISDRDGEPWFVGRDVCAALAIRNSRDALNRVPDDEKGVVNADTLGGEQAVTIISEPGMYRLVLTSRTEAAERFKKWVVGDVLPAIRRTGRYAAAATDDGEVDVKALLAPPRVFGTWTALRWIGEARRLFGEDAARDLWRRAGFPDYAVEVAPPRLARQVPPALPVPTLAEQVVAAHAEAPFGFDWRGK